MNELQKQVTKFREALQGKAASVKKDNVVAFNRNDFY